ncbi:transposase family protein [Beggiatoa alba B18LD]|uniref:Transposase family protein n=1 Tax=Beggiatoa alba B18LD TaxID=395493 RepID=I3CKH8_9GAMM|nr:transposase [Beggiatoa alba]EIJ44121.1 transposase family protein [Beggiatoa alba B18LD]
MNLTRLFCEVDDFCNAFIPEWEKTQLNDGCKKRRRTRSLSPSEIITLIVFYHSSGYRTFIGKVFGDRGYLSKKLAELLALDDVELITTLKKNMKPRVFAAFDKILLRKHCIIETINDQLKNIFDLEHSRHRSLTHYMINVVASLVTYSYQDKLPSLNIARNDLTPLL